MEDLPHSHNYRETTILQGVAYIINYMGKLPIDKSTRDGRKRVVKYREQIFSWLTNNTLLTSRTIKDYAKIIEVRSQKEITWS
jgi:hypothetical protein